MIRFSFYKDHSNSLFKDLQLHKRHHVFESEIIKSFSKFLKNELPKSLCSNFNLVHEVLTCNTQFVNLHFKNVYLSIWLSLDITLCAVMVLFYGINSLNIFFKTTNWLLSFNWSHFLWSDSYKLAKMNCKFLTHAKTISSQFSLLEVLLWNVVQLLNRLI